MIYDILYHSASLRIFTIHWNTPRWSATPVNSVRLQNTYSDTNKHFWRRCRGSNWLKLSYNWVKTLTVLSPLILAGLPLLSLSCLFDAEQCITGFDLPSNFDPNPQRIGRIVRRHVIPPQKKPTWNPRLSVSAPPMAKTSQTILGPVQQPHPYWTEQWPRQRWLWAQIRTGEHGSSESILWQGIRRCQRSPSEFPGSEQYYQPQRYHDG